MDIRIAPSILSCDFANLTSEVESISDGDLIHVDVMDGHFVPNLTIGPPVVSRIAEVSKVPLDVHLMIENPEKWIERFAASGHSITFHYEATSNPKEVINLIKSQGQLAAMAIKPRTEVSEVAQLLPLLDMILVMTVEPGFGGQQLMEDCLPKIAQVRKIVEENSLDISIQADGGITAGNIASVAKAGADTFVVGKAIFDLPERNAEIAKLRALASNLVS